MPRGIESHRRAISARGRPTRGAIAKRPETALPDPDGAIKGVGDDRGRYRRRAYNHASELAENSPSRFVRRNSKVGGATGAGANLGGPVARDGQRGLWARGGPGVPGRAWADSQVNVVSVVAWAGVGKSTLVNHWLRRLAADQYRSANLVFGWSFYRQGTSGAASSADEFLDAVLAWFGDPDPRVGTAWEKGERLAKLIANRRTLLVLDGLEPLQNPPGPQEGRVREPSLQALLRELAAFNRGLCVITTRLPVTDLADHERTSALRHDLEHLRSEAGAKLLRALSVQGPEEELRNASDEFGGHCLALTLLGSYLTDAYQGDICWRQEVSTQLTQDIRQGVHARKVMETYQSWLGEGP